jgi:microcompartment protein CcmK/EutM
VGDRVLLIQDGRSAQLILGKGVAPVDAAVIGVVDAVELG